MNALKQNLFKAIDFTIKIQSGPDAGKAFRIQPPKIILGRDPNCQITLTDPKVSRQQCVIRFANNVTIEDLSSHKTTRVNNLAFKGKAILKPGDIISFGQTKMIFDARTNVKAQPQLPGQQQARLEKQQEKQAGRKNLYLFMGVIIALAVGMKLLEKQPIAKKASKLATAEDLKKQIDESKERLSLRREIVAEKRKLANKQYLYQVERHFISGFRDFQNGRYSRAIDSFGTTIATDQTHAKAQLYSRTARKKQSDLIDTHLRDGQKYRQKMMYSRCAAEFEKALILINNRNSKKYELAKSQLDECRELKTGGYQ